MADPDHTISRRHFTLAYRSGAWQITDESSNGTFVNREESPIGKGTARGLRDNDRLRVGPYEIEVLLQDDSLRAAGGRSDGSGKASDPFAFDDPFGDPLAPAPDPAPGYRGMPDPSADYRYPREQAPIYRPAPQTPFHARTQDDHSSVMNDAMLPPARIGQMPLGSGGLIPADDLLPDDWEKDLLEGIGTPAQAPNLDPFAPAAAPPLVPPLASPLAPPLAPPPAAQSLPADPLLDMPFAASPAASRPAVNPFEPPPASVPIASTPPVAAPFQAPLHGQVPVPPQAPSDAFASPVAQPADPGLMDAFLEGIGIPEARPSDAAATMRRLGEAFRAMVSGLRAVLMARASIKSEFRIEQTMFQARGNNPLTFSADDDDAITALLGVGRRIGMAPATAVSDALRDIRLHELASIAAMQSAVRAVLAGLDPDKIRADVEQAGGLTLLPAQKKARAWDAYDALHQRTVQALSDDFDSVFGKAFARAYEEALQDLNARERR